MSTESEKATIRRPGRPPDPQVRPKILAAAIDCYAELGWSGFNFDAVATRASIGRPALYRRWDDREALLIDAFRATTPGLTGIDSGSLRTDLIEIAIAYATVMVGTRATAGQRLFIEQNAMPTVFSNIHDGITTFRIRLVRTAFERAAERGEVRSAIVWEQTARLMLSGIVSYWGFTDRPQQSHTVVPHEDVVSLVDAVLYGTLHEPD